MIYLLINPNQVRKTGKVLVCESKQFHPQILFWLGKNFIWKNIPLHKLLAECIEKYGRLFVCHALLLNTANCVFKTVNQNSLNPFFFTKMQHIKLAGG